MTLEQLAEVVKKMETDVEKLKVVHEVQNLMGRYMAFHTPEDEWRSLELYAKRDDSSHESFAGYFKGQALTDYLMAHKADPVKEGMMFEHDLCTPYIVVADDLQTARGIWWSPGWESFPGRNEGEDILPVWAWSKYAVDFIKEDGKWFIWHTHFYLTFMVEKGKSWSENPVSGMRRMGIANGHDLQGSNLYLPDETYRFAPKIPEPYATFTEDMMRP